MTRRMADPSFCAEQEAEAATARIDSEACAGASLSAGPAT
jgi:hypothetical protein